MYVELFLKNVKRIRVQFKEMEIYLIKGFSKVIATVNEYQKMVSTIQLLKKKNKLKPHAVSLLKYQCLKLTNTISKPDKDVLMANLIPFFVMENDSHILEHSLEAS